MNYSSRESAWLMWFLRGLSILCFTLLFARLFELQILKGEYYRKLSEGNRIRREKIPAPRGKILARGGETLAVWADNHRQYFLGEMAAHITGYLGEISSGELGKVDPKCIEKGAKKISDYIGQTGLEAQYDCQLRGINGEELIEVDTDGNKLRNLGRREPIPGTDLKTNLNYGLQKKVAEIFRNQTGAVVVTDPKGEILALYSSPSYDPNMFSAQVDAQEVNRVLNDSGKPFFNRVIGGIYHPGSVFKPLVALAGLSEKKIDRNFEYNDAGFITIENQYGKFVYNNWYFTQYGRTEGSINVVKALKRSCDTFFYKLGEMLGVDKIISWTEKFGLTEKTGIDLPGEVKNLIPDPLWKERTKNERWFLGNTYHLAIGQGDLALTPMAVNSIFTVFANGGKICQPVLVGEVKCRDTNFKQTDLNIVRDGMAEACSKGGTGSAFFDFNPLSLSEEKRIACKTGTAETGEKDISHAWFSAFAPVEAPEIVVTVLVERGGEGSSVAGPIVRQIMDYWFDSNKI